MPGVQRPQPRLLPSRPLPRTRRSRKQRRMTPGRLGAILAVVVLAVDQAVKAWILHVLRLPDRPPIRVGPFFDLVMVWNRGISYGLFQQHEDWGRWALVALSIAA